MNVSTGAMTAPVYLSKRGDILSGPVDLFISKPLSSFKTPGSVISKSDINGKALLSDGRECKFSCIISNILLQFMPVFHSHFFFSTLAPIFNAYGQYCRNVCESLFRGLYK